MAEVDIGSETYDSYTDLDFANTFLAADAARADGWIALVSDDLRGRALVTATRLLLRLQWRNGPPPIDTPPEAVKEATALLAADIAAKPALGDNADTSSNVKSVGAGSAKVEFFSPKKPTLLPPAVFALLRQYLGSGDDDGTYGTAFGSDAADCWRHDWRLMSDYGADWRARDWSV